MKKPFVYKAFQVCDHRKGKIGEKYLCIDYRNKKKEYYKDYEGAAEKIINLEGVVFYKPNNFPPSKCEVEFSGKCSEETELIPRNTWIYRKLGNKEIIKLKEELEHQRVCSFVDSL